MDNLRSVLNIVLSKIPTSLIVNSEIQYGYITELNVFLLSDMRIYC